MLNRKLSRKVGISHAKVILADEPTGALDTDKIKIWNKPIKNEKETNMAKRTKKQNRVTKRKETRKRKKAKTQSQPKLLRKNPLLKEALNYRHPLVACLINEDWQEHKLASIYIIRKASSGLVLSSFLVDIAGVGLKDAWGDYGLTEKDIEEVKTKSDANGNTLIPCDVLLINNLVYGGIFWAKKWKFKLPKDYPVWLRLLEPVDKNSIKIDRFGENGKPVLFLDEDDLGRIIEREFDPRILEKNLEVEEDGLPQETLNRIGDIKAALIDFSRRAEFTEDFKAALNNRVGSQQLPKSEYESINFQDWFILEYQLEDGKTVTQRFAEHYKKKLSDDVRRLLLGWETVIESLFEVKDCSNNKFYMKNLINEREYTVFPTPSMENFDVKPGDFMVTRIVPTQGFHIFSGAATITRTDGSLQQRARM